MRPETREASSCPRRTVVIGIGNLLLRDEGVGVHIARAMQKAPPETGGELTVIDGGTCPDAIYLLPERVDKLIIVDAARGGGEPGTIYRFTPQDIAFRRGAITSLHQLGLLESLSMIRRTELEPKDVVIVGVEPKDMGWGLEMSPEVGRQIPRIIAAIEKEIDK
jgi:hydrogenase maturation protease